MTQVTDHAPRIELPLADQFRDAFANADQSGSTINSVFYRTPVHIIALDTDWPTALAITRSWTDFVAGWLAPLRLLTPKRTVVEFYLCRPPRPKTREYRKVERLDPCQIEIAVLKNIYMSEFESNFFVEVDFSGGEIASATAVCDGFPDIVLTADWPQSRGVRCWLDGVVSLRFAFRWDSSLHGRLRARKLLEDARSAA